MRSLGGEHIGTQIGNIYRIPKSSFDHWLDEGN